MPPKRKSTASSSSSKRTKPTKALETPVVTSGKAIIEEFETDTNALEESQIQSLIKYTHWLEAKVADYEAAETSLSRKGGKELSPSQIIDEARRLRGVVTRGIEKLMKWKPSCKIGSATFSFEGICNTPAVMASFLGLEKAEDVLKFKAKKYTSAEFEDNVVLDSISASARYSSLYLTGNVNLRWNHETGEYKFTGRYGRSGTGQAAKEVEE